MNEIVLGFSSALWLGILTSISPCPLATNIAAVSYLSKNIGQIRRVLHSGIAYTLGRMIAYAMIGFIIVGSLLSVPVIAQLLQRYLNKILGPILILTGLFLLDVLKMNISGFVLSFEKQKSLGQAGLKGSFALGFLFALSFCPVSAGLFFGGLIPLSLENSFGSTLPFIYGLGTALPVLIFAVGIALGMQSLSRWLQRVSRLEVYVRKITGIIFLLVGLYYLWGYVVVKLLPAK